MECTLRIGRTFLNKVEHPRLGQRHSIAQIQILCFSFQDFLLQALEFTRPGDYKVTIGGLTSQAVRVRTVTNMEDQIVSVDRRTFETQDSFTKYMEDKSFNVELYSTHRHH